MDPPLVEGRALLQAVADNAKMIAPSPNDLSVSAIRLFDTENPGVGSADDRCQQSGHDPETHGRFASRFGELRNSPEAKSRQRIPSAMPPNVVLKVLTEPYESRTPQSKL